MNISRKRSNCWLFLNSSFLLSSFFWKGGGGFFLGSTSFYKCCRKKVAWDTVSSWPRWTFPNSIRSSTVGFGFVFQNFWRWWDLRIVDSKINASSVVGQSQLVGTPNLYLIRKKEFVWILHSQAVGAERLRMWALAPFNTLLLVRSNSEPPGGSFYHLIFYFSTTLLTHILVVIIVVIFRHVSGRGRLYKDKIT